MREIKFRAWNGNRMHYTDNQTITQFKNGRWVMLTTDGSDSIYWAEEGRENNHLMQYTGLKDKNGKEIYEGDIIETETCTGVHIFTVKYDIEKTGYICPHVVDDEYETYIGQLPNSIEIIGNIYENSELLKV
jgi:uncharacterized phage protein (TIGR01671 family)